MIKALIIISIAMIAAACGSGREIASNSIKPMPERTQNNGLESINSEPKREKSEALDEANSSGEVSRRNSCFEVDTGDNVVLKRQTFAIDFEPFAGACFVTSHNPEFDDPPMESEIAIFSGGKKIFDFPDQFNGATFGCWIEAIGFQDLNADGLKDIVVVGKCSAKSAAYFENVVYVNNGLGFTTNSNANFEINELRSVKDIAEFVKTNQKLFFK